MKHLAVSGREKFDHFDKKQSIPKNYIRLYGEDKIKRELI